MIPDQVHLRQQPSASSIQDGGRGWGETKHKLNARPPGSGDPALQEGKPNGEPRPGGGRQGNGLVQGVTVSCGRSGARSQGSRSPAQSFGTGAGCLPIRCGCSLSLTVHKTLHRATGRAMGTLRHQPPQVHLLPNSSLPPNIVTPALLSQRTPMLSTPLPADPTNHTYGVPQWPRLLLLSLLVRSQPAASTHLQGSHVNRCVG